MDTEERNRLVQLIVEHVADYRQGEIPRADAARTLKWLEQFDEADRPIILRETERLLSKTYISRAAAKSFIEVLVVDGGLAGATPNEFWKKVGYLRLQSGSQSQTDMLSLLDEVLTEKFGLNTAAPDSSSNTYVYLDDVSFSGNQIKNELLKWAREKDIRIATVHIIVIAAYSQGEYYAKRELNKSFDSRKIDIHFWAMKRLENSPGRIKDSEVMWPTHLPDEPYVNKWKATFAEGEEYFKPRQPGGRGSTELFSTETARETIEQAFLKKGAYIYSLPKNPTQKMRPLGFSALRTPGFGATIVTYRNCPNNAPLVLWWGDPNGSAPLNQLTPLLQRRPRAQVPGIAFDVVDT
jgi:hypothetical protein